MWWAYTRGGRGGLIFGGGHIVGGLRYDIYVQYSVVYLLYMNKSLK
jgi:hypothetical protein